ncbi:hypothetical protein N7474_002178 [Penicillium riverlandense]|uniref:uncharacterized protein n=1 Tax=Penicillium riverlandense TaxID=1903569 RepID=UPI002548B9DB|nr:uncharacterized protein N7474_002178 [Penicillium riverlandense]KAJ5833867.1 hypothetical protein N7474_002178 [Penicillium riverlandense]
MDLQGNPIPPGNRSTKVTTDPAASRQPIEEPSGPVANDSLAAESVSHGGAFSENWGAEPMGVSGQQSTLTNTDTSSASTLPSAPVGAMREDRERQTKYPEGLGGQGDFPGRHVPETGYTGGPEKAKKQMGLHAGEYPASEKMSGRHQAAAAGGSGHQSNPNQKPKGKNLTEGGFESTDRNNASFNSEIGSKQDPGRAAEQKFQRHVAESGNDVGGPRQKGVDNQNWYQPLEPDQRA